MASKRHQRRKQCGDKKRHATAAEALDHIQYLRRNHKARGALNAYRCQWCGGFHVGHVPGSARTHITRI